MWLGLPSWQGVAENLHETGEPFLADRSTYDCKHDRAKYFAVRLDLWRLLWGHAVPCLALIRSHKRLTRLEEVVSPANHGQRKRTTGRRAREIVLGVVVGYCVSKWVFPMTGIPQIELAW
jgi:hypothetical protein